MSALAVCSVSDLVPDVPKEVQFEGKKVLIIKHDGHIFAVGSKCSHYGLPLSKGVVYKSTIRCPFHGACFSLRTGDIEDFPGIDRIPCYKVQVEGEVVKLVIREIDASDQEEGNERSCGQKAQTVLVIGGGIAAFEFVHTLQKNGFGGKIVLVTEEDAVPYDRTKLSKSLNVKKDDILIRGEDYYSTHGVCVLKGVKILKVDTENKKVVSSEEEFSYDRLFLATGSRPRRPLRTPGIAMYGIYTVRTFHDTNAIWEQADGKRVVIVGSSFIGMEVAAALKPKAASVSLIGTSPVPFRNILGAEIGSAIRRLFESKGIVFHMGLSIAEFIGKDGHLSQVILSDGQVLPADVCVLGLGSEPNSSLVDPTQVAMEQSGHIKVNAEMETSAIDVFAGGDVVSFPLNGEISRIGHWQMAQSHGKVAALKLMGRSAKLHVVPYFWSGFFGKSLRFAGHNRSADNILIDGVVDDFKFVAYFFDEDQVSAVAAFGRDEVPALFASVLKSGGKLSQQEVRSDPKAWIKRHRNI